MTERCERCDRPKASLELCRHPGGCECTECVAHCWGCSDCEPHDWRAEALALRQRVEKAERASVDADIMRGAALRELGLMEDSKNAAEARADSAEAHIAAETSLSDSEMTALLRRRARHCDQVERERDEVRTKYQAALTVLQELEVFADDLTVRANGLITPADTTAIESWQRIYVDLKSMADEP